MLVILNIQRVSCHATAIPFHLLFHDQHQTHLRSSRVAELLIRLCDSPECLALLGRLDDMI